MRMVDMAKLLAEGASQSGHERNHLFHNVAGREFVDLSGISGLDHPGDSRSFVVADFDRDGWQDIAFVNANRPLLRLLRSRGGVSGQRAIWLRFQGGNTSASPSKRFSSRDGVGTRLVVELADGRRLMREHHAGEGLAAQNSSLLHVGVGKQDAVEAITVRWPSGVVQRLEDIPAGSRVTVYEDPESSPEPCGYVVEPQVVETRRPRTVARNPVEPRTRLRFQGNDDTRARLRLYTTVASWCQPCLREIPYLRTLNERFSSEELALFGVPIESEETAMREWARTNEAPYTLLYDLSDKETAAVQGVVRETLRSESLPASIVTDAQGNVLLVRWGPPSVSQIRKLLHTR